MLFLVTVACLYSHTIFVHTLLTLLMSSLALTLKDRCMLSQRSVTYLLDQNRRDLLAVLYNLVDHGLQGDQWIQLLLAFLEVQEVQAVPRHQGPGVFSGLRPAEQFDLKWKSADCKLSQSFSKNNILCSIV